MTDLASDAKIDFAQVELSYEGFRSLARNPHLSVHGRIGFPDSYRESHEPNIFADIRAKLPALDARQKRILDIGPGCANLPRMLMALCEEQGHELRLIDSPEMLSQLPDAGHVRKHEGAFPGCMARAGIADVQFDAILCYSVLHYMFIETNLFSVVDATVRALAPGGRALFGDIPNLSKRRRFFASEAGHAYHKAYTGKDEAPEVQIFEDATGRIDDSVLLAMMQRAQQAGCDAYLVPQSRDLPMANRRDDLIIGKP
ncbi:class I SAM-dependent methyltransferase [Rhizobium terrae]|uniref:class I SAM-dependent methyltransferase n=1 Tax=Rhizobium terrae TaxID=2171756 RepID=UPI0013C34A52|nr:class I SAM-dependent methyltransferase [Rhizobium terrae]